MQGAHQVNTCGDTSKQSRNKLIKYLAMKYSYRKEVLQQLSRHGVTPHSETPPELVREFINDLYVYEIRAMKKRLQEGAIAMADYAARIEELRDRYPILSLPLRYWTTQGADEG
jgi:hypothetical protein